MMMTVLSLVLTTLLVAPFGQASTVMDIPLPFSIFEEGSDCDGKAISKGTINSVIAMEPGTFCENTIQKMDNGDEVIVYTKVVFTSCEAVEMGTVFLDAYTCTDSACSDCTDVDNIPVSANLLLPEYSPLPAADTCWGIEATSTGVTVLNKFDNKADADGIDAYWRLFTANSCMKETYSAELAESSASVVSTVLAATMGTMLVAFLMN